VCCAGPAAAAAAGDSSKAGRKLKQVTVFYDTPAAAGSTSVGVNANAAVSMLDFGQHWLCNRMLGKWA
jgi:hypothetical protein